MKKSIFFLALIMLCSMAFSQTATVDNNKITKVSDVEFTVNLTVTPKKATTLLVESISSREDTKLEVDNNFTITVIYSEKQYLVSSNRITTPETFAQVSEARKFALKLLREHYGIS